MPTNPKWNSYMLVLMILEFTTLHGIVDLLN